MLIYFFITIYTFCATKQKNQHNLLCLTHYFLSMHLHSSFLGVGGFTWSLLIYNSTNITSTPILQIQSNGINISLPDLKHDNHPVVGLGTSNPSILHDLISSTTSIILPNVLPSTTLTTCLHFNSKNVVSICYYILKSYQIMSFTVINVKKTD